MKLASESLTSFGNPESFKSKRTLKALEVYATNRSK